MSGGSPELQTERLVLRRYRADDIEPMAAMFGDPDVTAHTFLGRRTREQTQDVLAGYIRFWDENGFGMRSMYDRATGEYAGESGLFIAPMGRIALRYALPKSQWGRGIATEASIVSTTDAFEVQGLDDLMAGVKPENTPSHRVLQKLGWREVELYHYGDIAFTIYEVTRREWKNWLATHRQG